ncbi:aldehyde dehydrogenase family protein [Leucobacter chromiiresistens]|uniref:Succinate-semialdehyde dehydrogenase n=1 Tax=Leucobacter chromiiresistens TaxID=1079994 RepID=A0A147EMM2_9MICO|nr:aldehyde dehydrogenase family protein [Leucobacter chromiiresistens]KTR85545.1 succinate-semialdehyde dehydrogenase [Leucobacter chromiiresistens]
MHQSNTSATSESELHITNPSDGTSVGSAAITSEREIRACVQRAREAWPAWRATPPAQRGQALRAAARALAEHEAEVADLHHRETGRDLEGALGGVRAAVDTLLQYSELAPVHRGRSLLGPGTALDVMRPEPRGVAAIVTPWNDPVAVSAGLIGAALAMGNTVVHKPSERCPHLGALLGAVLGEHLPAGVLATVTGGAREGEMLVGSMEIDLVAHVGSTHAGERIARSVALTGAHLVRENGGNDALIVDAGVPVPWAAEQAAIGAFTNGGQICTSVERIFVHRDVAEAFVEALAAEAERWNAEGRVVPLVDERMRESVHDQVRAAADRGARALVGGVVPEGPGSAYPATVLVDVTPEMTVMREETFGPVAPVMVVADFAEGLERASADEYGLSASVLTPRLDHAHEAIDRLAVGTVKINHVFGGAPGGAAQPRGRSGAGFGYGPELLDEMSTVKVAHLEAIPGAE